MLKVRRVCELAVDMEKALSTTGAPARPQLAGEGGGSVCGLIDCCTVPSSSSTAVKDCFSLEGEVMGDCPLLPGDECGDVEGRPTTVVGDEGEEGRRKGDARGELKDNGDGL
jgi:hypothetical protein